MSSNRLTERAPGDTQEFAPWQQLFDELAGLLGLTLVVYNSDQKLLGSSRPNRICEAIQATESGIRLCERDCGGMLAKTAQGGSLGTFKCHASLYSFSVPIYREGKVEFVLLGGRVFRNYQDFAAFTKVAPEYALRDYFFVDWDNALKFESAQYFQKAARFIQSMVDAFAQSSQPADRWKKQAYQLGTLFDLSSVIAEEPSSSKIGDLILQALAVLFDVQSAAVMVRSGDTDEFRVERQFGSLMAADACLTLPEGSPLTPPQGSSCAAMTETYPLLKLGFPETVQSLHGFPILSGNGIGRLLLIFNARLEASEIQVLETFCRHVATALNNSALRQEMQDYGSLLSVVTDFSTAIGSELETRDLHRAILLKTAELLKAEQASLMIFDESSNELQIKQIKGLNEKIVNKLRIRPGEGICGSVFEKGRSLLVKDIEQDPRLPGHQRARYRTKSFISVPLKINHRKIGVLNFSDKATGQPFDERDLALVESIASHASVALDRTDFYQKSEDLRRISITDALTELYNRRFFQERLTEEIERAKRHNQPIALFMMDLDNFKNYNDTYGHLAGDEALRIVAATLKKSVRNIDVVARYGGEEFAVILPMTGADSAKEIAERIRTGVAGRYFPDDALQSVVKLTVSTGIASFPDDADNWFDLVGNADKALYLAKVAGKNKVCLFGKARSLKNASGL
ncbi:MAG: diguanylate cyclase [Acidobacteriota bacterium]